jgi:hypothetical protein
MALNQILVALTLFAFAACKTANNHESAVENKRSEMAAIVKKYMEAGSTVSINWDEFYASLSDDAVVEKIDMAQFEACVSNMVSNSINRQLINQESGCEALYEQAKAYTGKDFFDFRGNNAAAFSRCDSISNALLLEAQQGVQPCRDLLRKY